MIKFIYGNPGTGKTEEVFRMLEEDARNNRKAFLIVPEQMTVEAEREALKRLPAASQLNIEVLNYTRLANKLFREHGGVAYNISTRGLQKLLMWRALMIASPMLSEYCRSGSDDIALADSFLATYNEFTAAGVSMQDLECVTDLHKESTLSRKIKDIVTVCSIYSSLLSSSYSDNNEELIRLSNLLKKKDCLKGINVYFDGFSSITGVEHAITKSIFTQAENCAVTIGIPSPAYNGLDTVSIKRFSDKLRGFCASIGAKTETLLLNENHRTNSPYLKHISQNLWEIGERSSLAVTESYDQSVQLYRAADIYDECEFAAVIIRELIESGYRYNEIAIIARNADKYRGIIEPALENMDIPYFISEKTDPSLCPLAKLILSALKITTFGWQRNDIISHLKTGLCCIDPRDADIFESYTAKWNINGKKFTSPNNWNMNPDGYTDQITERGEQILSIANEVKNTLIPRLMIYASELKAACGVREICLATVRYLEELNVRESLKQLAQKYLERNKTREASECMRMYDAVLDALDCVCDAFNDDNTMELSKFYTAVKAALEEGKLGSLPTSTDEVTIGSANMLRTGYIKCTVILGACDGEFPSSVQDAGLLSDNERDFLINHNVMLSGDREMRSSDELYFFRRAAASPSEKLIILTRADTEPSIAFTRIRKIFEGIKLNETTEETFRRFKTIKSVSEYLHLYADSDLGEALKRLLSEHLSDDNNSFIADAPHSLSAECVSLSSQTVNDQIGQEIRLSQSKIEEYLKCKFAYSCKYYLKLDDNKRASFAYNNIGAFIHKILERFLFAIFVTNKGIIPDNDAKQAILSQIIDQYTADIIPDGENSNARLRHLIERLKSLSLLIVDDILEELSDSSFIPTYFELPIGSRDIPSITIALNNGKKLTLNGIVDRVDVFEKDGKSYIRVVDYKTGNKVFSLADIEEGKNLQLLIYIFSLTANKSSRLFKDSVPIPAGITYLSANNTKIKAARVDSGDEVLQTAANEIKRSGLILDNDDVLTAVSRSKNNRYLMASSRKNSSISQESFDLLFHRICEIMKSIGNEILTGNANAIPVDGTETCQYCPYSWVCRTNPKNH